MMTVTINMISGGFQAALEGGFPLTGGSALFDRLEHLDKLATLAINGLNTGGGDSFWLFVSSNFFTVPFYLLGIVLIFYAEGWRRGLAFVLTLALAIGLSDQICNLVKAGAARFRPSWDPEMLRNGVRVLAASSKAHCYGFFSAHAALSFAMAFGSARVFAWGIYEKHRRGSISYKALWPAIACWTVFSVWAIVVAASRIFLAKHFLGDIIVGAVFGTLLSCALVYITKYVIIPRIPFFAAAERA